jgi:hypothetical protein
MRTFLEDSPRKRKHDGVDDEVVPKKKLRDENVVNDSEKRNEGLFLLLNFMRF